MIDMRDTSPHAPRSTASDSPRFPRRGLRRALAIAGVLALTGCGLLEPVDTSAIQAAEIDPDARVIRFAHPYEPTHPVETCGVATLREELVDDGIHIESYPSAQIGSEAETTEQVATGGLELAVVGPSFLGVWHEDAEVLDGAFIFTSVDEFDEATTGPILNDLYDEVAEETGLRVTSTWYYGTRHITSNVPITSPEDLQGLKVRTPDAPLYLTNFGIMGGNATPMALSEAYLGLQQGAIDAQENPIPTIAAQNFQEVQEYINLTAHSVQGIHIVASEQFVTEALDEDERRGFDAALEEARVATRDCIVAQEEEILAGWEESGAITINDDVDVAAFQELIAGELPSRVPWGDLYLEIQESV